MVNTQIERKQEKENVDMKMEALDKDDETANSEFNQSDTLKLSSIPACLPSEIEERSTQ